MSQEFTRFSQNLSEEVYQGLKRALELGKWPDGQLLTEQQRETCMQAVISYEAVHLAEDQRAGYLGQTCKSSESDAPSGKGGGEVDFFPGKQ